MPKILLIDDEKSIRRSLREILEFEKYQVDEAEDGLIGISKDNMPSNLTWFYVT